MKRLRIWLVGLAAVSLLGGLVGCSAFESSTTPSPADETPAGTEWATSTPAVSDILITPIVIESPAASPTPSCNEAPSPRLIVGEHGRVSDNDLRPLNVRSGPSTGHRILGRLEVLDVFYVLDGPECGGNYLWYFIDKGDLRGWIAEGDRAQYYVELYLPG